MRGPEGSQGPGLPGGRAPPRACGSPRVLGTHMLGGGGVPCRCPRGCGAHRRSGPQPAWDTRPGLLSHQRLLKPPQGPASPAPQGPQSWKSRPAGPSCGKLRALQLVRGRQGGWAVSTSLPRSGPGPLIPSFSSTLGGRSRPASHGSLTLLSATCGCSGDSPSPPLPVWTPMVSLALLTLVSAPSTAQVLPGGYFQNMLPAQNTRDW